MESATTKTEKKKQTSLDLRERANQLKAEIEKALLEAHGEVTEHIDELFDELAGLEPDVIGKIESLRWAHMKVKAQKAASKAIENFYKDEAQKAKVTTGAREKNIERIKDMVLLNLHTLEAPEVRLSDGNKVYIRTFFKATVDDEEAAYAYLKSTDIVDRQTVLDGDGLDRVKDAVLSTLEAIQTPEGEPVHLEAEVHTKLMHALDVMKSAQEQYKFDGKALNTEVERLHKERKEQMAPVLAELQQKQALYDEIIEDYKVKGDNTEIQADLDRLKSEIETLHGEADKIHHIYSIPGVSYQVNESVFGL